jgi:hypothetical protein
MSEFLPGVGPVCSPRVEITVPPLDQAAIPAKPEHQLTPEQIKAVDAALAKDQESATVVGLMGLWGGSMLLKDLAKEHFSLPAEEEEQDARKKPSLPEAPPAIPS